MPRRREVPKRPIIPDPKYRDKLVSKFINAMMLDGKKATAERALDGVDVPAPVASTVRPNLAVRCPARSPSGTHPCTEAA